MSRKLGCIHKANVQFPCASLSFYPDNLRVRARMTLIGGRDPVIAIYKPQRHNVCKCTAVQHLTLQRNFISAVDHADTDPDVRLLAFCIVTGSCKRAKLVPVPQSHPPWFPSRSQLHLHPRPGNILLRVVQLQRLSRHSHPRKQRSQNMASCRCVPSAFNLSHD
jgi:hypothetical protein